MKLSASIYVDNQAEIGYPVAWLVEHLPESVERIYIFASDDSNLNTVLQGIDDPRVVSEPIGVSIRVPTDIAKAQNESLRRVDRKSYDAHLVVQADIWTLPIAFERLAAMPYQADSAPLILHVEHVRLHAQTYRTWYGVSVFFPEAKAGNSTFDETGDGAYPRAHHCFGEGQGQAMALDIGWHCAESIVRHLRVHARTWNSNEQDDLVRLYDSDKHEFMRRYFDYIRKSFFPTPKPMPLDGAYGEVVEAMNLRAEYDQARALLGSG